MPKEMRRQLCAGQQDWIEVYQQLNRELLWRKMDAMLADQYFHFQNSWCLFQALVDNMDRQYLDIRKAKKELFDFDPDKNHGCDIDFELADATSSLTGLLLNLILHHEDDRDRYLSKQG